MCATGEMYTHSHVARNFFCSTDTARTLRTFLCVLHTCMAQGCLQCACRHLSVTFPFVMFHPSLLLLFLDGHFETTPDYDLIDFDVHDFLPNFSDLKAQVKITPLEDELFGYLTKSALNTISSAWRGTSATSLSSLWRVCCNSTSERIGTPMQRYSPKSLQTAVGCSLFALRVSRTKGSPVRVVPAWYSPTVGAVPILCSAYEGEELFIRQSCSMLQSLRDRLRQPRH